MSKCISVHGEYSEHEYTSKPICDYCGQISEMLTIVQNEDFRDTLVAIQELHPIEETGVEYHGVKEVWCPTCRDHAPCPTRNLADEALGEVQ